jgi:hypothetical protein
VIGVYFALGLLVMISRLLVPARRRAVTPEAGATMEQDLVTGADKLPMAA